MILVSFSENLYSFTFSKRRQANFLSGYLVNTNGLHPTSIKNTRKMNDINNNINKPSPAQVNNFTEIKCHFWSLFSINHDNSLVVDAHYNAGHLQVGTSDLGDVIES